MNFLTDKNVVTKSECICYMTHIFSKNNYEILNKEVHD